MHKPPLFPCKDDLPHPVEKLKAGMPLLPGDPFRNESCVDDAGVYGLWSADVLFCPEGVEPF